MLSSAGGNPAEPPTRLLLAGIAGRTYLSLLRRFGTMLTTRVPAAP